MESHLEGFEKAVLGLTEQVSHVAEDVDGGFFIDEEEHKIDEIANRLQSYVSTLKNATKRSREVE